MKKTKHYYLAGIGGIGMSSIAKLLLSKKEKVSGSDLKESRATDELKSLGANIYIGHRRENVADADIFIYSSAIKDDNPEMQAAKARGIVLIKRAQALAQLMSDKTVITVTGSHGKTTTTSLAACLLMEAGLSPTASIGGILKNISNNAFFGQGKFFVAEADESDGSFLYYRPKYSIITNIDHEHLDYYGSFANLKKSFLEFIDNTQNDGCIFCCSDDANLQDIIRNTDKRIILFGINSSAQIYAKNIVLNGFSSEFDCFCRDKFIARFMLSAAGAHNVSNALAVIALGLELGIDLTNIKNALSGYKGAGRRMDVKFKNSNYTVLDDYAHHPTEIKATLSAVKNLGGRRVIVMFQPHRYTRTKLLLDEFASSFDDADSVFITDIYAASEPAIEGVHARNIVDMIKKRLPAKEAVYLPKDKLVSSVLDRLEPQDLIITLGAGDITKISDELASAIKKTSL